MAAKRARWCALALEGQGHVTALELPPIPQSVPELDNLDLLRRAAVGIRSYFAREKFANHPCRNDPCHLRPFSQETKISLDVLLISSVHFHRYAPLPSALQFR